MKALTLYQPYATLIAAGEKRIETRTRRTLARSRSSWLRWLEGGRCDEQHPSFHQ